MKKFKATTLVEVVWLDTEEDPSWQTLEKVSERPDSEVRTVGFVIGQDDEFLYVTGSLGGTAKQPGNRVSIPLGCVKGVWPVVVGRDPLWTRARKKGSVKP